MKKHESNAGMYAVVVWFNPDIDTVTYWNAMAKWVSLVVVDNTEAHRKIYNAGDVPNAVRYISCDQNQGIAAALNLGLQAGSDKSVFGDHIPAWCLQFDQDSRVDQVFLQDMKRATNIALPTTAAIAPCYYDTNVERIAPVIEASFFHLRKKPPVGDAPILASYVISSGCMINLKAAEVIGLHDESLFIDFVDIEWGLRATHLGYRIWVLPKVLMTHCLGDNPVQIGATKLPNHSPLRHYYYFRNVFLMARKPFVPAAWKVIEFVKLPVRFAVYALYTKCKKQQIKSMLKGTWHGVLGVKGKQH
ncbi:glycosyltransferase family 2 protein [Vibrio sp. 10N.261.52.F3]|uniref:glycosyltransferase family 2 protein n=1 Tax=Vibrio sp. 10N.261.52.F3 TaxID=3229683 RepID=UPI003553B2DE